MRETHLLAAAALLAVTALGCGQEDAVFPDAGAGAGSGACGPWYPGGATGDGGVDSGDPDDLPGVFGVEEGKTFPCLVWESARLDHRPTYVNMGEEYLAAAHGKTATKAIVVIVSARNCSNCATLMSAMAGRADALEEAGALPIAVARRIFMGSPEDPDLTLEEAEEALGDEGWPLDRWVVTNDEEHHLSRSFDEANPWTIVVRVRDMRVMSVSNQAFSPNDEGVRALIEYISNF